jgi:hypothetical protein
MEVDAMPKTSVRKKSGATRSNSHAVKAPNKNTIGSNGTNVSRQASVQTRQPAESSSMVRLIMPAMVALGCWGMTFTFVVFSTDPNRLLFGGMAALMAIMWSVSFGIRARNVLRQK